MTIVKKDISKDGKTFYTFIDESFKETKSGKGVIVRAALYFPKSFIKDSQNGKHKFINVSAEKLLESIIVAKDKDDAPATSAPVTEPVKE
ncbi:MAG: hypothetical protein LBF36_00035 [Mycoplasmataceae bacterium]|jgi:hypothetical protein|nr:hypothetical protein [Mycoplasmataceae bacterium]